MNTNQQFIKGAIITVIIAAVIGALTVMAGEGLGDAGGKLSGVCFALIFFGITGTISMVVTANPAYKGPGNAGMIVSSIAFIMTVILIFAGSDNDMTNIKVTFALFIAAIALAHICLLHHFNLQNKHAHSARITATIFISLFSLIIIGNIFGSFGGFESLIYRQSIIKSGAACLILDLAATLLVPLCNRLKTENPVTLSFTEEEKPTAPAGPGSAQDPQ